MESVGPIYPMPQNVIVTGEIHSDALKEGILFCPAKEKTGSHDSVGDRAAEIEASIVAELGEISSRVVLAVRNLPQVIIFCLLNSRTRSL